MALKIDLSDLKEGDKVFTTISGIDQVVSISVSRQIFFLKTCNSSKFSFRGELVDERLDHPVCFHSIDECIEYFQSVKNDIEKPNKRYWLWILSYENSVCYFKTGQYVDENGLTSLNDKYTENWEKYRKVKLENDWIEVNSNNELVNWNGRIDV